MSQDRLETVEISLAYQEKLVLELNQVVCEQQKQIDKLEKVMRKYIRTIQKMPDSVEIRTLEEERPPHY